MTRPSTMTDANIVHERGKPVARPTSDLFAIDGVLWVAWTDGGSYVWKSDLGSAWRDGRTYRASGSREKYPTLKAAMLAAIASGRAAA